MSEQITVAQPIVSDATSFLTRQFCRAILSMFIASDTVTIIGSPSGTATTLWRDLVNSVCINSEANLERFTDSEGKTTVRRIGNPTECALLALFTEFGTDYLAAERLPIALAKWGTIPNAR